MDWAQARKELERGNAVHRQDWEETMEYLDAAFAGTPLPGDEAAYPYVDGSGNRFRIVKRDDAEPERNVRNVDNYTPTEEDKQATDWRLS
jgi:hypothetical protein